MHLGTEIKQRFKERALEHLEKDEKKHSHYLQKVAFAANSVLISQQDFGDALTLFSIDPQESVEKLRPIVDDTMGQVRRAMGHR